MTIGVSQAIRILLMNLFVASALLNAKLWRKVQSRVNISIMEVDRFRKPMGRAGVAFATLITGLLAGSGAAVAVAEPAPIRIGFVYEETRPAALVSPLDEIVRDEGLAGARLGIADNRTTGRFTGQDFALIELRIGPADDVAEAVSRLSLPALVVVSTLRPAHLRSVVAAGAAPHVTVINAASPDDALRGADCRPNLLHTIPSRAMLADALAQYLVWKKWRRWFLVIGPNEGDRLYAEAIRRAAGRFGAEIVVEKAWTFKAGSARADTGHVMLQTEIPAFTQVQDHDVLVVADETNEFGEYLGGRTARPRPIAGTHGLVATGWSPVAAQWGAMQLQNRFLKQAGRRMTAVDYAAWLAVRSIGEAAIRTRSTDAATISAYLRDPEFLLSGFKGQGQSFRAWDGQMRQPILIAGPKLLVSVSPQPGFLHRHSELDTLGVDREESLCKP